MRIFTLLSLALILSACQPQAVNKVAQQQHFICKSLIDGFLKTQGLGEYQLDHLQPTLQHTTNVRDYSYRASSDQSMKINVPQQQNLAFQCLQNSAQQFEIKLRLPANQPAITLLSLNLPPEKTIDTLTAFALKTQ